MISQRNEGLYQLLIAVELILVVVTFLICAFLIGYGYHSGFIWLAYFKYAFVAIVALLLETLMRPVWLRDGLLRSRRAMWLVTQRQWLWMIVGLALFLVFSRDQQISRIFMACFTLTSLVTLFLSNRYGPQWLMRLAATKTKTWRLQMALVGPNDWCRGIVRDLKRSAPWVNVLEVIPVEVHEFEAVDHTSLSQKLYDKVAGLEVDILMLPTRALPDEVTSRLMQIADTEGFRCWMPLELSRRRGRRFDIQRFVGWDILTPPPEPLENTFNRVIKRLVDVALSSAVLMTVVPVASVWVWYRQRRYSPGPLFFHQDRLGRGGRRFRIVKFRTLHVNHGEEAKQVSQGDARIFKGGDLLRKLSVDELPQFWNVLRGDMSAVGPRPHLAEHEAQFQGMFEQYGMRRYVKPGLTGLAQVKGCRGEVHRNKDVRDRARYDKFYVTHWSLGMDLRIILKTVLDMIRPPKSAY